MSRRATCSRTRSGAESLRQTELVISGTEVSRGEENLGIRELAETDGHWVLNRDGRYVEGNRQRLDWRDYLLCQHRYGSILSTSRGKCQFERLVCKAEPGASIVLDSARARPVPVRATSAAIGFESSLGIEEIHGNQFHPSCFV